MTVLITGFEPFGAEKTNPSCEAVYSLPEYIGQIKVIKGILPVSFESSAPVLKGFMEMSNPDVVICVGQAGGYAGIALERIGINIQDASIPDNDGRQPQDQPIIIDGPAAYFSTLPIKGIASALHDAGIPAFISNSAGTYVCNHTLYSLLHLIQSERKPILGGFIHVPFSPEQAVCKNPIPPSMEPGQVMEALKIAIQTACS